MKIVVGGFGGLLGKKLIPLLEAKGYSLLRLVRSAAACRQPGTALWSPDQGLLDADHLEGAAAIIHLGGEPIAEGRWTREKKRKIRESRIAGSRLLSRVAAALKHPPPVFLCASAIGIYPDLGDGWLDEDSSLGTGFLAELVAEWEAATLPARDAGIRVVNLRIGIVLTPDGGALAKMMTPFRWGLGGTIGKGSQFMSWIAEDDLLAAVFHCLEEEHLRGAVNLVAPDPVTNRCFTKRLGAALKRPTLLPVPAFVIHGLFGEMGRSLLLSGARVTPKKLLESGFSFRFPHLEEALGYLLNRGPSSGRGKT